MCGCERTSGGCCEVWSKISIIPSFIIMHGTWQRLYQNRDHRRSHLSYAISPDAGDDHHDGGGGRPGPRSDAPKARLRADPLRHRLCSGRVGSRPCRCRSASGVSEALARGAWDAVLRKAWLWRGGRGGVRFVSLLDAKTCLKEERVATEGQRYLPQPKSEARRIVIRKERTLL